VANQFNREEIILFEQVLQQFDTDNTIAKQAARFTQPGTEMQRTGDRIWRPSPQIAITVDGLDITGKIGSITQMSVPADLTTIANVPWQLDAKEMRDPLYRDRKAKAASQALSARINRQMAFKIRDEGSLTVPVVSALTGYDDISLADALMMENDIVGIKTMVLNPRDYNLMGGDLARRTLMPRSVEALDNTDIGPIANFNTFKTAFGPTLVLAAGSGYLINGGNQRFVPSSTFTSGGATENQDNRFMNLNIDTGTGIPKAGDKFTIAGVNALSHINKETTGQLKTFTIVENITGGAGTITVKIAPPIIVGDKTTDAEDDYANVDSVPANGAAITFTNTQTVQTNPFFINDSIEVFGGRLAFDEDMAGVAVMRQMTDTGIEIIFAKQGNVITGKSTYRLTIFFGVTNLNPEMNGILIGGQT